MFLKLGLAAPVDRSNGQDQDANDGKISEQSRNNRGSCEKLKWLDRGELVVKKRLRLCSAEEK